MAKVTVTTVPETRENSEVSERMQQLVEDRNKSVASWFKEEPKDIKVELYQSTGLMAAKMDPNGESLGVFAGYIEGEDKIMIAHVEAVEGLMGDVWKEMSILADYCLVKYYLCQKYYPERSQFKLYYKYLSEGIAEVASGRFKDDVARFDIKTYFPGKKYRKDQEIGIIMYFMREQSGLEFIFDNLDKFIEDCDVKKTLFTIYKKSFEDFIRPEKDKIIDEEKKIRDAELKKRQDAFRARQAQQRDNPRNNNNQNRKFVSKAKYNANNKQINKVKPHPDHANKNNGSNSGHKKFDSKTQDSRKI